MPDDKILNGLPTGTREDLERFLPEGRSLGDLPTELLDELQDVQFTPKEIISDRFEVIEQLGFGGMGAVYTVKDLLMKGQLKALKVMLPSLVRSPEARERFISEAQIAQSLRHEGIATVYDIGTHRDILFLTMELLEGTSLDRYLKSRGGKLDFPGAVGILLKICDGLIYAHNKGVIHRDIKPQNIFVLPDARIKLLDFGLAKLLSPGRLTRSSIGLGTAYYMSPEQSMGKEVDERSDIFSLGVVFYQMLVGRIPMGRFKLPSMLNRDIPPSIDPVVEKCLDELPEERYLKVQALVDDIEKVKSRYEQEQKERIERGEKALAERKRRIEALLMKGKSALDRNNFDEAITAFHEILQIDSGHKEARQLIDRATADKTRFEELRKREEERRKAEVERRNHEECLKRDAEEAERKRQEAERRDIGGRKRAEEAERRRKEEEEAKRKKRNTALWSGVAIIGAILLIVYFGYRESEPPQESPPAPKEDRKQVSPSTPSPAPPKPAPVPSPKEEPTVQPKPGSVYNDPVTGMEFVFVRGGTYQMGDTFGDGEQNEKPAHEVFVSDFWMAKYEVTQGQWEKVMGTNPSHFKKGDNYPLEALAGTMFRSSYGG